jgi:hypothetical protein
VLVRRDIDTRTRQHFIERAPRQLPVVWIGCHLEQDVILLDIGVAARDQLFDDRTHLGDMFGRARLDGRTQAAERVDVGVKLLFSLFGDLADRFVQRQAR